MPWLFYPSRRDVVAWRTIVPRRAQRRLKMVRRNMGTAMPLRYEVIPGWEQLPAGFTHGDCVGVDVDSQDNVYVFTRYQPRVIVYNRDGGFLRSWGEELFTARTHGLTIGPDDRVYCVDEGNHCIYQFSPTGELLMTIGTPGLASETGYDGRIENIR